MVKTKEEEKNTQTYQETRDEPRKTKKNLDKPITNQKNARKTKKKGNQNFQRPTTCH